MRKSTNFTHFTGFSGIITRGPNRSEIDRHLCRWDERIRRNSSQNAAFFMKSEQTIKQGAVALSSPVSTVYAARNTWGLIWERLVVLGCCLLAAVTKFQGKLASLQQVNSPNSQDNFQICCGDMYLVRFLANFAGFCMFLWILRDFADLLEIRGSMTARNIRSPVKHSCLCCRSICSNLGQFVPT